MRKTSRHLAPFLSASLLLLAPQLLRGAEAAAPASDAPRSKAEQRAAFHPPALGEGAKARLAGYARRVEMEAATPFGALSFRCVGPELQGGRVVDIEAPAGKPDTLLVAFASGGLFRTENRGGSWTPLFDHESSMTLGAIALGDPAGNVLWAGTGEANSSRTSYAGTGVFKSTDAGKSWRNVGLTGSHHVGRILVDPRAPDTVLVAAIGPLYTDGGERGVYRTTDGGASWSRVLFVDDRTGAIDLARDPAHPEVVFAATWQRDRKAWDFLESGPGSGIWRSTDGGATWAKLSGGLPSGDTVGRIGLAVAPSRPGTVYAVIDNQARRPGKDPFDEEEPEGELTARRLKGFTDARFASLPVPVVARFLERYQFPKDLEPKQLLKDVKAGKVKVADLLAYLDDADRSMVESDIEGIQVWRSDDSGATWRKTHDEPLFKVAYTYGYYFGRIWVAPDDADRVYVAGVPLVASRDGGKTWKGLDRLGVHGDHHALHFEAGGARRVALGNDGGLNLSWDGGETWTKVNNLPVGQFTTVAVDSADPYHIVGGLQDNGVLRGTAAYAPGKSRPTDWAPIYGGDGGWVEIDPKDPNVVYTASQFGASARLDLKTHARDRIRPRHALKETPLRYNWVTPFVLSPHSRNILYYGTNRLYRSFDRGDTFAPISPDLTSNRPQGNVPFGTITTISESPKTFGVIYCGTDEGKVWGTRDGGVTWKDLSNGLASDRWVTRVVASAFDEGTVYVSQNGYRNDDFAPSVFRSTDFGATWTSIAKGLPDEPVNSVREDPKAKHLLYAATDLGVFVSLDRGDGWFALTGGLPHVPVHDVAVQPREGDLVVGTHGRSVWVAEAAPLRELTPEVAREPLHAFKVKAATWDRRRGYDESPFYEFFRVPETRTVSWWSGAAGPVTVTVEDAWGNVWKERKADGVKGFNAFAYDLSVDAARAQKAFAALAERERKAAAARADLAKRLAPPAAPAEEDDGSVPASGVAVDGRPLSPELDALLADPYLAKRTRYLPPGRYTVEIAAGGKTASTTLVVKAPKKEALPEDED